MTDNGKVFIGRFGPSRWRSLFGWIYRENSIGHRHTAVGRGFVRQEP
jgi:hypothetical protein